MCKSKVLAVVGPTGSGKTTLAVKLAKKFNGVIMSADSRQVYKGLNIGTNKEGISGLWYKHPARVIDGIAQLLVDIANPGDSFTLNDWLIQARYALEHIFEVGQLPIVVGGTGLYVTALLEGYQLGSGRGAKNNKPVDFQSLILMPEVERTILNQRSDERIERIFDDLVAETKKLLDDGVQGDWLEKIGLDYRYAFKHITGSLARDETIRQLQTASRAYIRRQLTWHRHHGSIEQVRNVADAIQLAEDFRAGKLQLPNN